MSSILNKEHWMHLRASTRVHGIGKGMCEDWCEDALKDPEVKAVFHEEALTWESQIDQYATLVLSHHWLEGNVKGRRYVADGTAGQFTEEYSEGFYNFIDEAPERLKVIYQREPT